MSAYDFNLAKKTIQKYSDLLEKATMGMVEDWFWTAETVYKGGVFQVDMDDEKLTLGGINSSSWATPTLQLLFKDGTVKFLDCYTGITDLDKRPDWLELGCLSQPCQDEVDSKRGKFLN